jgi:hypothetical protein
MMKVIDTKLKESERKLEDMIKMIKANHNFNKIFLEKNKLTKQSKQISLFLPLNRLFGFYKGINRVFRGLSKFLTTETNVYSKQYFKRNKRITNRKTFISSTAHNLLDDFDLFKNNIFMCLKLMFKFVIEF